MTAKELAANLKDFLEKGKSNKTAFKDTAKKLGKIEFEGDAAVPLI